MSRDRKVITADHVNGLHLEKNANVLSAMATDGPANVGGRGVRVFMTDGVLADLLTHLAVDPRWSAAFDAMETDRHDRIAETAGTRTLPEQLKSRARLAGAMRSAMAERDLATRDSGQSPPRSGRPEDDDTGPAVGWEYGPRDHSPARTLPEPQAVHRLNLPSPFDTPLEGKDQYAALVSYGGAILAAERGEETELVRPDGRVAARIVPA